MAKYVYFVALAIIFGTMALTGAVDLGLYLAKHQTISAWLRNHPAWYFVPMFVFLAFIVWFTVHLFGE